MEKIWLYAAIGGFIPIIFWVIFWLREDIKDPEPRWLITKTFLLGIAGAFVALCFQALISKLQLNDIDQIIAFSFVEEFIKFLAVFIAAFGTVWVNERNDPMIYMITGALGFSAVENMYYILDYLNKFEYIQTLINGSYRFIGATLLHTVTSAVIGIFISIVFFQSKILRISAAILGILLATGLHSVFNLLVDPQAGSFLNKVGFYGVWIGILVLLIVFEIIRIMANKKKKNGNLPKVDTKNKFRKRFF